MLKRRRRSQGIYREGFPMTSMRKVVLTVAAGTGAQALTSIAASAGIVCSENVCWHTQEQYSYPPDAKVVIHDDSWRAAPHMIFREQERRGSPRSL
jgi:hypothetical protein